MAVTATADGSSPAVGTRQPALRIDSESSADPAPQPADVLAALGHEMSTPLATLRATLEVLAGASSSESGHATEMMRRLERSVGWLEGLVGDLTTWSLLETGRLPVVRRHVRINECLDLALDLVKPLLDSKQQRLLISSPRPAPPVEADSRRLGQVLVNLLRNACRHSPVGSQIDVTVALRGDDVEVRVTDQGVGIPRRQQRAIFAPYVTSQKTRPDRGTGLGLGLHIAKTLVERHGGTVGVDSKVGQGASFWVRLPLAKRPAVDVS